MLVYGMICTDEQRNVGQSPGVDDIRRWKNIRRGFVHGRNSESTNSNVTVHGKRFECRVWRLDGFQSVQSVRVTSSRKE